MKILVFGNSGSGKSTLARCLGERLHLPCLDLDTVAWKADQPGVREPKVASETAIRQFISDHPRWILEGCYGGLIAFASVEATHAFFLNPGVDACVENCRNRPWESHKYATKSAQDRNLAMLLDWVRRYKSRDDEFSLAAHRRIFDEFTGIREEVTTLDDSRDLVTRLALEGGRNPAV